MLPQPANVGNVTRHWPTMFSTTIHVMDWIYLDNNATTRPADEVVAAMRQMHEQLWANPSSVHRFGQMVRQRVELARAGVGRLINARPNELLFTSGGTESNNLAIRGLLHAAPQQSALITTHIEHAAVREPAEDIAKAGCAVEYLPVNQAGVIDLEASRPIISGLLHDKRLVLMSVQWANNETGVIQPIHELSQLLVELRNEAQTADQTGSARSSTPARVYLHVDATQAVGKIPVDVKAAKLDLLTLAGHKFHGPKGAGALYVRSGVRLRPQIRGGPQERDRRGGTENTPAIIGLGVAAELAATFVQDAQRIAALTALRDRFEKIICQALPETVVHARQPGVERLWNTSNLGFASLEAEAILLGLSERGVCASAGAACSSGSLEPSPVLLAMGIAEPVAHGSVRFSLSRDTTQAEVEQAAEVVIAVVERLRRTLPVG